MIIDSRDSELAIDMEADIAIVGSGPAGISVARALDDRFKVLLIEAGGLTSRSVDDHYLDGEVTGLQYPLRETRARQLGGSTALWAGYCTPFDDIDFIARDWIQDSGWPLTLNKLRPYYEKAAQYLHMRDTNFSASIAGTPTLALPHQTFQEGIWRFGETRADFSADYKEYFKRSACSHILLHTTAREVRLSDSLDHVTTLRIRAENGREGSVRARRFILAGGGLETPRLLLSSDRQVHSGVGNSSDQVGRWFMEHPHVSIKGLTIRRCVDTVDWTSRRRNEYGQWYVRCAGFRPPVQKRARVLNARLHFFRSGDMAPDAAPQAGLFFEQAPNPDSRVKLSDTVDESGMRRVNLHWALNDVDKHSHRILAREASKLLHTAGIAEAPDTNVGASVVMHSNHQLGTTRMSDDPAKGVVSSDCRVHGIDNLYVAGGSVFPTVSWANPTFMVITLALRLADHIRHTECCQ